MYYVIKRQYVAPMQRFIGFVVEKYIASKNNDNVIFEFKKDDKVQRKWVKKDDIVLLTQNKEYFMEIFNKFKSTETMQQKLVDEAKAQLDKTIETFTNTMDKEIQEYVATKNSDNIQNFH